MAKLIITLEVADRLEAYDTVTKLGFEHDVKAAKFGDNAAESFGEENPVRNFMRSENAKKKAGRDVRAERIAQVSK